MKATSMGKATKMLFEMYPMGYEFTLQDLKRDVIRLHPPSRYSCGETFGRRLRANRYGEKYFIKCKKPQQSLYKKVGINIKKAS